METQKSPNGQNPPVYPKIEKPGFGQQFMVALGSATGYLVGDTLTYPLDTMNTWIKLSTGSQTQLELVKKNLRAKGNKSLLSGLSTQPYCVFLPGLIYFLSYDYSSRGVRRGLDYFKMPSLIPFIPSFTATLSEGLGLLVMVPMDALRTRMQSGAYRYDSVMKGILEIKRKEGFYRLYQASPLYFTYMLLFNSMLFQTYEYLRITDKRKIEKLVSEKKIEPKEENESDFDLLKTLKHTVVATSMAAALTNPIDVIITRYQILDKSTQKLSTWDIFSKTARKEGLSGLNRGLWFKVFYSNLNALIAIPVYEYLRQNYGYDFSD